MNKDTDRELLELAAKATGVTHPAILEKHLASGWNPFIDDGDALRLLVKLRLPVDFVSHDGWGAQESATHCGQFWCPWDSLHYPFREIHWTDPYAATRRAIVRAAAEIGRANDPNK